MKRKILLLTLAIPVILCQKAVAQTSSRLIAEAHWSSNGVSFTPVDSSSFNYSSNRGGDLTHTMKYDNSYTWTYDTAYHNQYHYIQSFDANNNDTSKITQFWNGSTWQNQSNTIMTYNSSNQMTTMILQNWNGSAWAPLQQDVYTYNLSGKMVTDRTQQWNSASLSFVDASLKTYYYDASGNKSGETDQDLVGGPAYTNQWLYTYSPANQLLTTTYSTWATTWVPNTLTTYTYDTSGDLITKLIQTYNSGTASWVNNTLDIYSGFTAPGSNLPTFDVNQTWSSSGTGTWNNNKQYTYTYNSFNQMTSSVGQSWNIVGIFEFALGDPMANYYYQTYSTVSAVKNVSNTAGDANVYPVPAQNTLNVDINWNEAQNATIEIYNAQGSVVRHWITPNTAQFHSTVSVDNLAEGIYFLKITGTQGQIVKQLVIAH